MLPYMKYDMLKAILKLTISQMIAFLLNKGGNLANKPKTAFKKIIGSIPRIYKPMRQNAIFSIPESTSNDRLWHIL